MLLEIIGAIFLPPIIWIVWIYIKHLIDCFSYPQGPFPLPLIGNAYLLGKEESCKVFFNLRKKYGDIFGFSICSIRYIVVNNFEGIQEVLIKKGMQYGGQPQIASKEGALNGLINSDQNPRLKVLRKIASSSLKIYSDGLVGMEKIAVEEYTYLNKKLVETKEQAIFMKKMIELSILNIICTILFNHRYEEDDHEFQDIINYSNLSVSVFNSTSLISSIPWLRYFPTAASKKLHEIKRLRDPILKKKLYEHRRTYDENNLRDITDALIKASSDSDTVNDPLEKITDDNIEFLLNDFIIAGSETSSSTILWFIAYMLHWPEYQGKLYDEIVKVTGSRYPTINDRSMLHLLQATINETIRLSSVAPLGLVHKAMENSSICGKFVPKGARIITNLWSIHNEESHWKNAISFSPERWLDKSGEFNSKLGYAYLPFSSGPRSCVGETLAKTEIFVFISRLVKDYRFEKPIGEKLPRLDGQPGVTRSPYDYKVIAVSRN